METAEILYIQKWRYPFLSIARKNICFFLFFGYYYVTKILSIAVWLVLYFYYNSTMQQDNNREYNHLVDFVRKPTVEDHMYMHIDSYKDEEFKDQVRTALEWSDKTVIKRLVKVYHYLDEQLAQGKTIVTNDTWDKDLQIWWETIAVENYKVVAANASAARTAFWDARTKKLALLKDMLDKNEI